MCEGIKKSSFYSTFASKKHLVMSIKKLFFLCFIIFSSISLSAQCDCERVMDKSCRDCMFDPTMPSMMAGYRMLFYPMDSAYLHYFIVDSLRVDSYICFLLCNPLYDYIPRFHHCGKVDHCAYLNHLKLSDSLIYCLNLSYEKNMQKTACLYEFIFSDDISGKCISTVNFYLTTTIPIYLNGVLIPLEQCENVLGAIRQEDLISVQRFKRKNWKKLERIEVITR